MVQGKLDERHHGKSVWKCQVSWALPNMSPEKDVLDNVEIQEAENARDKAAIRIENRNIFTIMVTIQVYIMFAHDIYRSHQTYALYVFVLGSAYSTPGMLEASAIAEDMLWFGPISTTVNFPPKPSVTFITLRFSA